MGDFHRHHYNFVAKRLRNHYPIDEQTSASEVFNRGARRVIEDIALEFAHRFKEDDPNFDAPAFLDQCSPDPDSWPFSELWEQHDTNTTAV